MNPGVPEKVLFLGIGIGLSLAGCAAGPRRSGIALAETPMSLSPGSATSAPAEKLPELTKDSGLADYLAYAALNNPALEAAFNRWQAALERVPQVRALPDPRLTYRFFIEEVETRVGAQRQSVAIAQKFPWFGKLRLRGDAAAEAANARHQQYQAQKLKLFHQVKDAYYEYYFLWKRIGIIKENISLLGGIEKVTRTRYKAAAAPYSAVIRAQVELGKLDDRLRTLADFRGPIVARLNAALNRPTHAPLPWPTTIADLQISLTDQQLLDWLEQSNPELKALDFEIARTRHKVELARKDYFPDVTLGMGYIETNNSTFGRHPSDDGKDPVFAMVSMNLPIWRDKLAAGVREARSRHLAAIHQKRAKANSLSVKLKLAAYKFRDGERKIDLYRDTLLPKAKQGLGATQASFQAGKATFTDLIDAQRILLRFELDYEEALARRAQREAELEMLVGREIRRTGNPQTAPAVKKAARNVTPGKSEE